MAEQKDAINPDHYKKFSVESIVMLERIYGTQATVWFSELNSFKYSIRANFKGSGEEDLKKRDWYLAKASELRAKIGTDKEIIHDNK